MFVSIVASARCRSGRVVRIINRALSRPVINEKATIFTMLRHRRTSIWGGIKPIRIGLTHLEPIFDMIRAIVTTARTPERDKEDAHDSFGVSRSMTETSWRAS